MSTNYSATGSSFESQASLAGRAAILVYGVFSYVFFLVVFLYTIGFVGGFAVSKTIDDGTLESFVTTVAIDVVLMALFAVQHSVMARPWFKRWWTQYVPPAAERSTYVLFASALLALLVWQWRPLPGVVWNVEQPAVELVLHAIFFTGWGIVLYSTFLIDHFELFGLRQSLGHALGWRTEAAKFSERSLYRHVRHPLMMGFLIAFWAAPEMSAGRFLFAAVITAWVLLAIRIEENTLIEMHGEQYEAYRRRVPALLPRLRAKS